MMCFQPENGRACGVCEACRVFGNSADLMVIEPEKGLIKVESIRHLGDELYLKPTNARRKCVVINDAECMNENAQNALLKFWRSLQNMQAFS